MTTITKHHTKVHKVLGVISGAYPSNMLLTTVLLTTVPPFTFSVWFPHRLRIGGRVPLYYWWLPSNSGCLRTRFWHIFGERVDGHTVVGAGCVNVEFTSLWINHINLSLLNVLYTCSRCNGKSTCFKMEFLH